MNHYTYRVEWSPATAEFVGRCIEFPSLSRWATTAQEALISVGQAVDEHVAERRREQFDVPAPLTDRPYSGKFVVRTSPALHARLAVEAAEQHVSMNLLGGAEVGRPSAYRRTGLVTSPLGPV